MLEEGGAFGHTRGIDLVLRREESKGSFLCLKGQIYWFAPHFQIEM